MKLSTIAISFVAFVAVTSALPTNPVHGSRSQESDKTPRSQLGSNMIV